MTVRFCREHPCRPQQRAICRTASKEKVATMVAVIRRPRIAVCCKLERHSLSNQFPPLEVPRLPLRNPLLDFSLTLDCK